MGKGKPAFVLIATVAMLSVGFQIWKTEASTPAAAAMISTTIKNQSLIQNTGCHHKGFCPRGTRKSCGSPRDPNGKRLCECIPC